MTDRTVTLNQAAVRARAAAMDESDATMVVTLLDEPELLLEPGETPQLSVVDIAAAVLLLARSNGGLQMEVWRLQGRADPFKPSGLTH